MFSADSDAIAIDATCLTLLRDTTGESDAHVLNNHSNGIPDSYDIISRVTISKSRNLLQDLTDDDVKVLLVVEATLLKQMLSPVGKATLSLSMGGNRVCFEFLYDFRV